MRRGPKPRTRNRKIDSGLTDVRPTPKPQTRDRRSIIKRKDAQDFLQKIGDKAKGLVKTRNDAQNDLALTGQIHKMVLNDEEKEREGLHESNHPYINSFNSVKGVGPSPPFTSDLLQEIINKRKTKKIVNTRIGMTLNQPGKIKVRRVEIPDKFKSKAQRKREKRSKKRSKRKSEVVPLTMSLRSRKTANESKIQESVSEPKKRSNPKPVKRFTRVKTEQVEQAL